MQNFKDLKVWEKAHQLVLDVYRVTGDFPKAEVYALVSQMRRSSASIPTNIAEGCGRGGRAEMARYLQFSLGSAAELEYQLLLARDLSFLDFETHEELHAAVVEVKRMMTSLRQRVLADN